MRGGAKASASPTPLLLLLRRQVEAMEGDLRAAMNELYIGKSREIASTLCARAGGPATGAAFVADLKSAVAGGAGRLHHAGAGGAAPKA